MSETELATRKKDRENQIIQHIFEKAFPGANMAVPEGKNFFAVNVDGYIYKITVTEAGRKV
jgi:hypothetical protein